MRLTRMARRRRPALLGVAIAAALMACAVRPASAQYAFSSLFSFFGADGTQPGSALIQASDGNLYGTTKTGGANGDGTVFRMSPDGAEDVLHAFAGQANGDGAFPINSPLVEGSDGNLYGVTENGGASNFGTVFQIGLNGTYKVLHSFAAGDGIEPECGLVEVSGEFYGTTTLGGASSKGAVFRIAPDGTEAVVHSFSGGSSDGDTPAASLVLASDGNLYGTTENGGPANDGVVFKLSGVGFGNESVIYSFQGGSADGSGPGQFIQAADGNLYGTAFGGGSANHGVIYKLSLSGAESLFYSFKGASTDGAEPNGIVQGLDGNFYGTTFEGGSVSTGAGTVFKLTSAGAESLLYSFSGGHLDGSFAEGLVQGSDGNLYGTTIFGTFSNDGTVFRVTTSGAETVLHAFPVNSGLQPEAGLIQASDGNLYGTTAIGGVDDDGTVYSITPSGVQNLLYPFLGGTADGAFPFSELVQATDGNLYGTTRLDGANGGGAAFKISLAGNESIVHSFINSSTDGAAPLSGLIEGSDGNLYGTTLDGGPSHAGAVYKLTLGSVESIVQFFDGADGSNPQSALIQGSDGNFYGTTVGGGAHADGTVFKLTPGGTLTTLYSFAGGTSDGSEPTGRLVQATDGNFYGTTVFGGADDVGTVFKVTPGGTESVLHSFGTLAGDGSQPQSGLVQGPDGNLYGVTWGGSTVYEITLAGALTPIHVFSGQDGLEPVCDLLFASDGKIYGTTVLGGANGQGTIFVLTPIQAVLNSLSPSTLPVGSPSFDLTVNGASFDPVAVVDWNGSPLTTTFVSSTQLTAVVPATDMGAAGTATVTVIQEGSASNALPFAITNPAPALKGMSPSSIDAGAPSFTLTLKGSSFVSSSTATWNGSALSTTFVSSSELKATVPSSLVASAGKATVRVTTPSPGGGQSGAKTFTILVTTVKLTTALVTRNADGSYTVTFALKNTGFQTAANTQVTKSSLGPASTSTSLPKAVGSISAGTSATTQLLFPSSAGSSGSKVTFKLSGTFSGGTFSGSLKVTLP